ncbi:DegT/DnrJ/EryC1/StrS family aminotransferase [Limnoraphis robusta]|uniref:DegT/DnrJ/EryC1/StrS family aminotransferase n=1 Tax=Limnoraphis robusta CCNP1315 TaxID=3110306 RepID=A0ABU5U3S2_9CYAN|nr:DegT/DnrJ/EryC1/StrS family aminotransferase [Limnoraphis robusta]MEA5501449.1 DegT/DnrJ/EryC1/StrS family aminotransferase [Limnoraphis robusta BA-68 BA1]MEA5520753.1 DegT/DnrJ/EryC1/StrS family aminotransferase [Limnoraphis robusta CCNP1315]MEA5546632.1 DegT/DnrJ/EryC1/StrS family aminotransferase [Limnoraphis robusta CCNP1324]
MNKIPPIDLSQQYKLIAPEVSLAVQQVLASGYYIGGSEVAQFEQQFGEYIGVSDCISCNSGTDALFLALRALDIGPDDQVIVPVFTFIATAEVVSAVGATPVFVDIDENTFNLDVNKVEAAITSKTKAIIPVHLFGQSVNMTRLMEIAKTHQLTVIEDCAQATGATWEGEKVGGIGDIGCFSFFPTKNLGACGDGGALTTHNRAIAAKIRMIKDHGQSSKYNSEVVGINSRLDALQAAILNVKLRYLDQWNEQRCRIAQRYHQLLGAVPGLILPEEVTPGQSVWNQYTVRVLQRLGENGSSFLFDRNVVRAQLAERGISTMVYYPVPLHLQALYQNSGYQAGQFPVAEQLSQEVLSLPMFPELTTVQQDAVIYAIKDCLSQ